MIVTLVCSCQGHLLITSALWRVFSFLLDIVIQTKVKVTHTWMWPWSVHVKVICWLWVHCREYSHECDLGLFMPRSYVDYGCIVERIFILAWYCQGQGHAYMNVTLVCICQGHLLVKSALWKKIIFQIYVL